MVTAYNLLNDLADYFGYAKAGQQPKPTRANSQLTVKNSAALICDYGKANRRKIAITLIYIRIPSNIHEFDCPQIRNIGAAQLSRI